MMRTYGRVAWLVWVALGAAIGFGVLAVWLAAAASGRAAAPAPAQPLVTVIPFPTATPVPLPTATPTSDAAGAQATEVPGPSGGSQVELRVGMLVAISGTEGDGLRLRALPGVAADVNLIALESEVFEITEGPVETAGRVWWYLVNPYDPSKLGWGASDYLVPADGQ
jgi:hypothetical protein